MSARASSRPLAALTLVTLSACAGSSVQRAPATILDNRATSPRSAESDDRRPADNSLAVVRRTVGIGGSEYCVIDDGQLFCWNDNQRIAGPISGHIRPLAIPHPVTSVAMTAGRLCAVTDRGTVWCRGDNLFGQLAADLTDLDRDAPVQVLGVDDALSVAVGSTNSCVVRRAGKVSCWSTNRSGEAGHKTGYVRAARRLVRPVEVAGVRAVVDVATDDRSTCAVTGTGETRCWGRFHIAGVYQGSNEPEPYRPRPVAPLHRASHISMNHERGCTLVDAGQVQCWGYEVGDSVLGHPDEDGGIARVANLRDAVQVAVGAGHACALNRNGRVLCWGANDYGQLGRPIVKDLEDDHRARPVQSVRDAIEVTANHSASCARTRDHALYCWGMRSDKGDPRGPHAPTVWRIR